MVDYFVLLAHLVTFMSFLNFFVFFK